MEFMSTSLLRVVERAQQDAEQGPEAIQSNGRARSLKSAYFQ